MAIVKFVADKDCLVFIDMEECEKILRKAYKIKENDDIIVFKIDYNSSLFKIPIVEYNLFGQFGTKKLSLSFCKTAKMRYFIPKTINDFEDYKYNPNNKYYQDKCIPFTSENNTDIVLKDRKRQFNDNNMSLCESICDFQGYIENTILCECEVKNRFNAFLNTNVSKYNLVHRFKIDKKNSTNFWVFKCYYLMFSKDIFFKNICSDIILAIDFIILLGAIIFKLKGRDTLFRKIKIV